MLKNTRDTDNINSWIGCEHVNKFVQSNQQLMLFEPHCTNISQVNEMTQQCTTMLWLLILNHTGVILQQGVSWYASLLK